MRRHDGLLALFIVVCSWLAAPSRAAESPLPPPQVVVKTFDGREFAGAVDARSDDDALWIRREEQGIVLTSAVPWRELNAATVGDEETDVAQLKDKSRGMASAGPQTLISEVGPPLPIASPLDEARSPFPPRRRCRIRHLEILDVCLVNLDRDVEPDGLAVTIAAIGEDGLPAPLHGSLSAELLGERRPAEVAGDEFDTLGQWNQRVQLGDFADGVATYNLPFRRTAPEWEFDLLPDAILTARLSAAGHGNYAASAPVLLRQFNPLRDNLQQERGVRFLPSELTGRKPLNRFGPQNGLWLHWMR